ncbi:MAG TPA: hypothetical protein VLT33_21860 [Labilithrix sp.]|nr:hypothetical protein [Labilithrix sp.]
MRRALVTLSFVFASMLTRGAAAQEAPRGSVALLSGYGMVVDHFKGDMSPYRFGFGMRAGVTFGSGGYLGGTFVKHLGTSRLGTREGGPHFVAVAHDTYAGPELGWDFRGPRALVRPFVGGGLLLTLGKTSAGGASLSEDHAWFYVAPGVLAAVRFGELFAGVDLRVPIVPAQPAKQWAAAAMLVLGMDLGAAR